MGLLCEIVEGWTKRLGPFTLKVDDAPFSLEGFAVELRLRPSVGKRYSDTTGNVVKDPDQATNPGQVYYDPDAEDFRAKSSPYALHWKVTDGDGKVVFFPSGDADTINVYLP